MLLDLLALAVATLTTSSNVLGLAADHAGGDGDVGEWVDQNKAARGAVELIGIEVERLGGRDLDAADFVQLQRVAGSRCSVSTSIR